MTQQPIIAPWSQNSRSVAVAEGSQRDTRPREIPVITPWGAPSAQHAGVGATVVVTPWGGAPQRARHQRRDIFAASIDIDMGSSRVTEFLDALRNIGGKEGWSETKLQGLATLALFRDLGRITTEPDGTISSGGMRSSFTTFPSTGSVLETYFPFPFITAAQTCVEPNTTTLAPNSPVTGLGLCVTKFGDMSSGLIALVTSSLPLLDMTALESGDTSKLVDFLLATLPVDGGANTLGMTYAEASAALGALAAEVASKLAQTNHWSNQGAGGTDGPTGGTTGETPEQLWQAFLSRPMLSGDPKTRIQEAAQLLAYNVQTVKPTWFDANALQGEAVMAGMLAIGALFGAFGQVQDANGAPVETNNWWLFSDKTATTPEACAAAKGVWAPAYKMCINKIATVGEGAVWFFQAVNMPDNVALQDALKSLDVGKLAEAIIKLGFLGPSAANETFWAQTRDSLEKGLAAVQVAISEVNPNFQGGSSLWKVTDYKPSFAAGGTGTGGDKPTTTTDEEKKEGFPWGKALIGGVVVLGGGYLLMRAYKPSEGESSYGASDDAALTERMANPTKEQEYQWQIDRAIDPKTPAVALAHMAEEGDGETRYYVAGNPSTPVSALRKLAKDRDQGVRWSVARNPNTPADALASLSQDRDWHVRQEVASNRSTPASTLAMLATDPDRFVSWAAKRRG